VSPHGLAADEVGGALEADQAPDERVVARVRGIGVLSGQEKPLPNVSRLLVFKLGGTAKLPPMPPAPKLPAPPYLRASESEVIEGRALYANTCRSCHGEDAKGGIKDLRYMSPETRRQFNDIVLGGIRADKGMASFKDLLTPSQVNAINAYLIARANEDWSDDAVRGQ